MYLCRKFRFLKYVIMEKDQFLELLHEQQSSGLSIKAYCEAHSIALSTFYFWKHRFLSSPSSEEVSCASLVPVHLAHPHSSVVSGASVVVTFPNGVQVEFASSNDQVAVEMLNTMCAHYV